MIGLSCYILADTFFIAKGLGADGLAALNLAIPIYSFVHGSGLMFGIGGSTKYSVFRGQKAYKNADQVFTNTVYLTAALAAVFVVAGLFLPGTITALLGANAEIFDMTRIYLKVVLLFAPAFMMNDVLICFVRNDGNPRLAMTAMLAGSMSNILLDYIFIFPFGMGIFGAVLATGFAPVISMGVLSIHRIKKQNCFHYTKAVLSRSLSVQTLSLGFPSLITEVAGGIVIIIFNVLIMGIEGNIGVAAYGVIANLSLVITSICTGIAQGMQPITSRAYGHGDKKGMHQVLKYAVCTLLLLSCSIYLAVFLFAGPITAVFNSENDMQLQQIAEAGLKLYFISIPFAGFNIVLSMFFTSAEKAIPAQVVSLLRGFFLIIPAAFILAALAGTTGVWLAVPVTEGVVAAVGGILYLRNRT
ncbi:MATE family efflux transporter [Clostridium sp. AN503]|uniref:MATE family efflux transporter n=1 Tax=Clostridium sp. AN503 TaxID=3160598 RepID=UPI00345A59CF